MIFRLAPDKDDYTPLTLCAARGSKEMFQHLFNKLMVLEWEFGFVTCRKLSLEGVDKPLQRPVEKPLLTRAGGGNEAGCGLRALVLPSVIEVIVRNKRMDILREGDIIKLLDNKWEQYAKKESSVRFWDSVYFACVIFLISVMWLPESKDAGKSEEHDYWVAIFWQDAIFWQVWLHVFEVLALWFAIQNIESEK